MKKHTFEEVEELLEKNPLVKNRILEHRFKGDPPKESSILKAEALLGVTFPEDYRRFLLKWGYMATRDDIFGIGSDEENRLLSSWLIEYTLEARLPAESPYYGTNLPPYYIVVLSFEGDAYACIDTRDPDGKVISWNFFDACYEWDIASSFVDFLYDEIIDLKESLENKSED